MSKLIIKSATFKWY